MYSLALPLVMLLPVVVFGTVVILWLLLVYPRQTDIAIENALVVAAHPDDCVIAAGEYGIECLRRGKLLRIVYMTCGAERADSELARLRRGEAELAWSKAGLSSEFLMFLGAPESHPDQKPNQSAECLQRIAAAVAEVIAQLPTGSVMVLPAAAERHVDHRTLRKIALAALRASGRTDIVIYEAPEYSNYISFICNPFRALRVLLGFLPKGWSIAKRITFDAPYAYYATFGRRAVRLPADAARLMLKCQMLSMFTSQGGEGLKAAFGRPDVLRRLRLDKAGRERELPFGMRIGGVVCTGSTLLFACSLLLSLLTVAATVAVAMIR